MTHFTLRFDYWDKYGERVSAYFANLFSVGFRKTASEDCEVLTEKEDKSSIDGLATVKKCA